MASKSRKAAEEGFEALYVRLEQTVSKLEEGNLTLEETVSLYEEGMKLARRCQETLHDAELKVKRLQESFAEGMGELREEGETYEAEEEEYTPRELPLE